MRLWEIRHKLGGRWSLHATEQEALRERGWGTADYLTVSEVEVADAVFLLYDEDDGKIKTLEGVYRSQESALRGQKRGKARPTHASTGLSRSTRLYHEGLDKLHAIKVHYVHTQEGKSHADRRDPELERSSR